jgi:UDP-glucose 4-epimerase
MTRFQLVRQSSRCLGNDLKAADERITGRTVPLAHAARRPGDPPVLVADASVARKLIGFRPQLSDLDTIVATAWKARAQDTRARKWA